MPKSLEERLAEAEAARDAALARVAKLSEDLEGVMRADDQVMALTTHIEALREALRVRGHKNTYPASYSEYGSWTGEKNPKHGPCDCGLTKALATIPTAEPPKDRVTAAMLMHPLPLDEHNEGFMEKVRGLAKAATGLLQILAEHATHSYGPSQDVVEEALTALYAIAPEVKP